MSMAVNIWAASAPAPRNLKHLTTATSIAKAMHGSSGNVHESPHGAVIDFPIAEKLNLAFQDVERFVPIVAMRRRACSFLALLLGDPIALRRRIGR